MTACKRRQFLWATHVTGIREAGCLLASSTNDYTLSLGSKRTTALMTIGVPQFHFFRARQYHFDIYNTQRLFSGVSKHPLRQEYEDAVVRMLDLGFIE